MRLIRRKVPSQDVRTYTGTGLRYCLVQLPGAPGERGEGKVRLGRENRTARGLVGRVRVLHLLPQFCKDQTNKASAEPGDHHQSKMKAPTRSGLAANIRINTIKPGRLCSAPDPREQSRPNGDPSVGAVAPPHRCCIRQAKMARTVSPHLAYFVLLRPFFVNPSCGPEP